jgi:hypothetical protein
MPYDLAIYRAGAIAELTEKGEHDIDRPKLKLLKKAFFEQGQHLLGRREYQAALESIEKIARRIYGSASYLPDPKQKTGADEFSRVSLMPPTLTPKQRRVLGDGIHLVGVLPPKLLKCGSGHGTAIINVRASITACALEGPNGLPKLWWTFEIVRRHPERGHRLSRPDVQMFLTFVRDAENTAIKDLSDAYFGALAEVASSANPEHRNGVKALDHKLGEERLRIRFVDSNDPDVAELIDTLQYGSMGPSQIINSKLEGIQPARDGMLEFQKFVNATNLKILPPIDAVTMTSSVAELGVNLFGVDGVAARRECPKSKTTSIVGVAQRPSLQTPYDDVEPVRLGLLKSATEEVVRKRSASRRVTASLAAREAINLEIKRKSRAASHPEP